MWFTYLLLYLEKVLCFSQTTASELFLIGQLVDAISMIPIGYLVDNVSFIPCLSQRKSWHFFGFVTVALSFMFLFSGEFTTFYAVVVFITVFQIGWASTQIAHLSLINVVASSTDERTVLNASYYSFTVLANLLVYTIMFVFLKTCPDEGISSKDVTTFRWCAIYVVVSGLIACFIFQIFVKESPENDETDNILDEPLLDPSINNADLTDSEFDIPIARNATVIPPLESHTDQARVLSVDMTASLISITQNGFSKWLMNYRFYFSIVVFTAARLVTNSVQVYLPLYVTETLRLEKHLIAVLPFLQYFFGFLASSAVRCTKNERVTFIIGFSVTSIASLLVYFETFLNASIASTYLPYIIFALFGLGGNLLVCSAFGLIAQLISTSSSTSAAVYASHSFFDKLASGFYVFLTQKYISNYSYLLSYMPIYVLIVAMPFLICLKI